MEKCPLTHSSLGYQLEEDNDGLKQLEGMAFEYADEAYRNAQGSYRQECLQCTLMSICNPQITRPTKRGSLFGFIGGNYHPTILVRNDNNIKY